MILLLSHWVNLILRRPPNPNANDARNPNIVPSTPRRQLWCNTRLLLLLLLLLPLLLLLQLTLALFVLPSRG
jgi:hypothetical protein